MTCEEKILLYDEFISKNVVRIRRDRKTKCWLVGRDSTIYPTYKKVRLNRLVYEISHKSELGTLFACHHCDRKNCINPEHIFAGTPSDNVRDALKKGRMIGPSVKPKRWWPSTFCGDFGHGY